jgi:hypothetical protein
VRPRGVFSGFSPLNLSKVPFISGSRNVTLGPSSNSMISMAPSASANTAEAKGGAWALDCLDSMDLPHVPLSLDSLKPFASLSLPSLSAVQDSTAGGLLHTVGEASEGCLSVSSNHQSDAGLSSPHQLRVTEGEGVRGDRQRSILSVCPFCLASNHSDDGLCWLSIVSLLYLTARKRLPPISSDCSWVMRASTLPAT